MKTSYPILDMLPIRNWATLDETPHVAVLDGKALVWVRGRSAWIEIFGEEPLGVANCTLVIGCALADKMLNELQ